jgi:hypothetical protein
MGWRSITQKNNDSKFDPKGWSPITLGVKVGRRFTHRSFREVLAGSTPPSIPRLQSKRRHPDSRIARDALKLDISAPTGRLWANRKDLDICCNQST